MKYRNLIPLILLTGQITVRAAVTIYNNEAAFTADLVDPSNFGALPANPHGNVDISGLSSQTTTFAINGNSYSFVFREGTFDTTLGGTASVATGPANVSSITTTGSSFVYEATTTDQGDASISAWGYDTDTPIASGTSNTVALFDFTGSPTSVYSFSMETADFEGGNNWSNVVAAYRGDGTLIGQISFDFPPPTYGSDVVEFIGFGADEPIGYIAFFVGEDSATGYGQQERIAVGNFKAGTSILETVPEPGSIALLGVALSAFTCFSRKRNGCR